MVQFWCTENRFVRDFERSTPGGSELKKKKKKRSKINELLEPSNLCK